MVGCGKTGAQNRANITLITITTHVTSHVQLMEIGVVGLIGVRGIAVCYPKIPDVVNKQKSGKDIAIIRLHNMVDLIAMIMELRFIQKHAH